MMEKLTFYFPLCSINIVFTDFHKDQITFLRTIYKAYLKDMEKTNACYTYSLTRNGSEFTVQSDYGDLQTERIGKLYSYIHYIVIRCVCMSADKMGAMVLHSAALLINDRIVLFTGKKRAGKTTALLYFLKNGATYVGDEIVVISNEGVMPYCMPLKTRIDSIEFLYKQYEYEFSFLKLPAEIDTDKQYLDERNSFQLECLDEWRTCRYVVLLKGEGGSGEIQELNSFEAMRMMLPNVRNPRSGAFHMDYFENAVFLRSDFSVSLEKLKDCIGK